MLTKFSSPPVSRPFNFNSTFLGTALAFIVAVLLIVVSGTILYFSPATDKWIPASGLLIFFLSVFSGSFFAAKKAGTKGLFHGLGVGVLFFVLSLIIGLFLGAEIMGLAIGKKLITALLAGSLGGIWGVGDKS
ncbi:TIGR04086 family membrane protein [Thermincola potens]|uniref:TIGR04086 family membrane protein n=1 Tax=Thermincola potens TaxID=863643 RepID=UPI0006750078|nr:TIGR04086 family membrane protein [Thermincola potens]